MNRTATKARPPTINNEPAWICPVTIGLFPSVGGPPLPLVTTGRPVTIEPIETPNVSIPEIKPVRLAPVFELPGDPKFGALGAVDRHELVTLQQEDPVNVHGITSQPRLSKLQKEQRLALPIILPLP
jgi:hypothetical protein